MVHPLLYCHRDNVRTAVLYQSPEESYFGVDVRSNPLTISHQPTNYFPLLFTSKSFKGKLRGWWNLQSPSMSQLFWSAQKHKQHLGDSDRPKPSAKPFWPFMNLHTKRFSWSDKLLHSNLQIRPQSLFLRPLPDTLMLPWFVGRRTQRSSQHSRRICCNESPSRRTCYSTCLFISCPSHEDEHTLSRKKRLRQPHQLPFPVQVQTGGNPWASWKPSGQNHRRIPHLSLGFSSEPDWLLKPTESRPGCARSRTVCPTSTRALCRPTPGAGPKAGPSTGWHHENTPITHTP